MPTILLIDDDRTYQDLLKELLELWGHQIVVRESVEDSLGSLLAAEVSSFEVLLLDQKLPGKKGIEFLKDLREQGVQTPVILMTEHYSPNVEIDAWHLGVCDFVFKPLELQERPSLDPLKRALEKATVAARLMKERVLLPSDQGTEGTRLIGAPGSGPMSEVYNLIGRAAREAEREKPVLIIGESGTGKDLMARLLFQKSSRNSGPMLKVPCLYRHEKELEEELFGYRGTDRQKIGAFEQAHGGALLLDDLGEAPPTTQEKVRRAIREGLVLCGGSNAEVKMDVWVIACAHRDFDPDFHFRFGTRIQLPALRQRGARDLDLLADHFLRKHAAAEKPWVESFAQPAREALRNHPWPGNVPEMQEVILHAIRRCQGTQILSGDLKLDLPGKADGAVRCYFRQGIDAALKSGHTNLHAFLHDLLVQELVNRTYDATACDLLATAHLTGLPTQEVAKVLQEKIGIVPAAELVQYVTLDQMAACVNRSKRTLEKLKGRPRNPLPPPDVEGGGGKADEWQWARVRPWLEQEYGRPLPVQFPLRVAP